MDVVVRDDVIPKDPEILARVMAVMRQSLDRYEPSRFADNPPCDHPTTARADDPLSPAFFLELSIARLLAMLEGAGLTRDAMPPLPSARDLFAGLRRRLLQAPETCWGETKPSTMALFNKVCQLWVAYDWKDFQGVQIAVLKEIDDLSAIADFLWNMRETPVGGDEAADHGCA